jgi:hypothetical protein
MGLPRQGVLEVGLGVEHGTTCREAVHQLRHRVHVEHGLSQHGAILQGFIPFIEPMMSRLYGGRRRLRRCHEQRDAGLRDYCLHAE